MAPRSLTQIQTQPSIQSQVKQDEREKIPISIKLAGFSIHHYYYYYLINIIV